MNTEHSRQYSLSQFTTDMSTISPNPNPNSSTPMINQSSTSNPPDIPHQEEQIEETRTPNWLDLPEEVWFTILSKLKTIAIIENAQKVCMLFRKLCKLPAMFKTIDMLLPDAYMDLPYNVNVMTRFAVDRSAGGLVDISLEHVCDDDTLMYIVDRSKNLKRLVLQSYIEVSDETLIEAVQKLPLLEDLQLIICKFSSATLMAIGRTCPSLKSFSLNDVGSRRRDFCTKYANRDARAIATTMPQLRHLQLIGSAMSNDGLKAILDGCPLLESLDLRACFHVNFFWGLDKRCGKIKRVRYPYDSTEDYGWQACERDHREHNSGGIYDSEYFSDESFMYEGLDPDIIDRFNIEMGEYTADSVVDLDEDDDSDEFVREDDYFGFFRDD